MKFILEIISALLLFVLINIIYLLETVLWKFTIPTVQGIKDKNEWFRVEKNNKRKYYKTVIHYYFDINPYYKPIYPRYIK